MGDNSRIEWTDATWNPIRGCTRVSEGCRNCYAEKVAARFSGQGQPYEGLVRISSDGPRWNGTVKLVEEKLTEPIRWQKPRMIFVNSMSDLFHEQVPDEYIDRVFAVMALSPQHTFQVLTKRPERMVRYFNTFRDDGYAEGRISDYYGRPARFFPKHASALPLNNYEPFRWPLPNVWLGVSVENQKTADDRIPHLLEVPAQVRFLSCEPLLGPVDFSRIPHPNGGTFHALSRKGGIAFASGIGIHWVICGGESGPGARPMHPDWARGLRDQCQAAGVAFHFKQWGEYASDERLAEHPVLSYPHCYVFPDGSWGRCNISQGMTGSTTGGVAMRRIGKKRAGRILDGRTWDELPANDA